MFPLEVRLLAGPSPLLRGHSAALDHSKPLRRPQPEGNAVGAKRARHGEEEDTAAWAMEASGTEWNRVKRKTECDFMIKRGKDATRGSWLY